MPLRTCPSCQKDALTVHGECPNCRGEWVSGARMDAKAPGRLPYLRKHVARGPPSEKSCPWCGVALKAFDVPGAQFEGDLFWGKETPRADTHCVAEGCAGCGGVWVEADQLARGGGRDAVAANLARLAEALA